MDKVDKAIEECIRTNSKYLNLQFLDLRSLPEKLPDSLQIINCSNNQITKLPEKLPVSLQSIYCSNNQITKLHIKNINKLVNLNNFSCKNNNLEDVSLVLLKKKYFVCDDKNKLIMKSITGLIKRSLKRRKFKKLILQCRICKALIEENFNDCSFVIAQYI